MAARNGESAHADAPVVAWHLRELHCVVGAREHPFHLAALDPVVEFVRPKHDRGGQHHDTELQGGEHDLPQLDLVAEHEHGDVAALRAE